MAGPSGALMVASSCGATTPPRWPKPGRRSPRRRRPERRPRARAAADRAARRKSPCAPAARHKARPRRHSRDNPAARAAPIPSRRGRARRNNRPTAPAAARRATSAKLTRRHLRGRRHGRQRAAQLCRLENVSMTHGRLPAMRLGEHLPIRIGRGRRLVAVQQPRQLGERIALPLALARRLLLRLAAAQTPLELADVDGRPSGRRLAHDAPSCSPSRRTLRRPYQTRARRALCAGHDHRISSGALTPRSSNPTPGRKSKKRPAPFAHRSNFYHLH